MRASLIGGILLSLSAPAVWGNPIPPISRDYDVRSLLVSRPDYEFATPLGVQPAEPKDAPTTAPSASARSQTPEERSTALVDSIRLLLGDDPAAAVSEKAGTLHVTASSEDQNRVRSAIDRSQRALGSALTVKTQFVTLNRKDIASFPPALRQIFDDVALDRTPATIDQTQHDAIVRAVSAFAFPAIVTAPRVTLFQNQRAYATVATQRSFVSDIATVKNAQMQDEFKPIVSIVASGTIVDLRYSSNPEGNVYSIDFRSELVNLRAFKTQSWSKSPANQNLEIQVPDLQTTSLHRLLTIAANHSAIFRVPDSQDSPAPSERETVAIVTAATVDPDCK